MIYVLSDIHGNLRRFNSVMEQIQLQPEDTLYVLGDVSDRHPYGMVILQKIMEMPNAKMLLGNHEMLMLHALGIHYYDESEMRGRPIGDHIYLWYRNGGEVTHSAFQSLSQEKQREIIGFITGLPYEYHVEVNGTQYQLVHSCPPELYKKYGRPGENLPYFSVWNRDAIFDAPPPTDRTVIFGHTPTAHFQDDNPLCLWEGDHMMGIDCGSGYPDRGSYAIPQGRLCCVRLDDKKVFYSKEG